MDETTPEPPPPNAGEQLDAIMADLDRTGAAWSAAGYGYDTPEHEAREAVFARLKAWNAERAGGPRPTVTREPPPGLRFAIDADCPNCGYPERFFDPGRQVFGCTRPNPCGYETPPTGNGDRG